MLCHSRYPLCGLRHHYSHSWRGSGRDWEKKNIQMFCVFCFSADTFSMRFWSVGGSWGRKKKNKQKTIQAGRKSSLIYPLKRRRGFAAVIKELKGLQRPSSSWSDGSEQGRGGKKRKKVTVMKRDVHVHWSEWSPPVRAFVTAKDAGSLQTALWSSPLSHFSQRHRNETNLIINTLSVFDSSADGNQDELSGPASYLRLPSIPVVSCQ